MKRQQFCITKITMWQHTLQVNDLKIQLYKHNIYIVAICFYPGHSRHEYWFIQNIDHSPWRHGDDRSKRYPTVCLYRINIDILKDFTLRYDNSKPTSLKWRRMVGVLCFMIIIRYFTVSFPLSIGLLV